VSTDSSSLWPMRVAKPMGNDCRNERLLARRPDDPHTFRLRMDSLAGGMCREQYGIDRVAGHELLSLLRQGDCFFVEFRGLGLRQKRPDPLEMTELPAPFPLPPGERRVESRRGVPSRGRRAKKRDLGQVVEHEAARTPFSREPRVLCRAPGQRAPSGPLPDSIARRRRSGRADPSKWGGSSGGNDTFRPARRR
jgi:hypothetical protein